MKNVKANKSFSTHNQYLDPWEKNYLTQKEKEKLTFYNSAEKTFKSKFTEEELKFLKEIHKGTSFNAHISYRPELLRLKIIEAEEQEDLKGKYNIDLDILLSIITFLSYEETSSLVRWACESNKIS